MGGGGGGGGGGSGGPTSEPDVCKLLRIRAILNSPQPSVVQHIHVGDVLDVHMTSGHSITVEVLHNGQPAGSITGPEFVNLINCIRNGIQYQAKVISTTQGKIEVEVYYSG